MAHISTSYCNLGALKLQNKQLAEAQHDFAYAFELAHQGGIISRGLEAIAYMAHLYQLRQEKPAALSLATYVYRHPQSEYQSKKLLESLFSPAELISNRIATQDNLLSLIQQLCPNVSASSHGSILSSKKTAAKLQQLKAKLGSAFAEGN
ncbi:MAG: hypothetical protein R2880_11590 [Deinococcales bacterium]